jgi:TonB family protein
MRLLVICTLAIGAALPLTHAGAAAEPSPFPPLGMARSYFTYAPFPDYTRAARDSGRIGKGWFELFIDSASGRVQQVRVVKSTGVKMLDDSAVATLLQWRAKPRTIHHAMIPVEFKLG